MHASSLGSERPDDPHRDFTPCPSFFIEPLPPSQHLRRRKVVVLEMHRLVNKAEHEGVSLFGGEWSGARTIGHQLEQLRFPDQNRLVVVEDSRTHERLRRQDRVVGPKQHDLKCTSALLRIDPFELFLGKRRKISVLGPRRMYDFKDPIDRSA